jgi:hypothetical protein
MTQIIVGLILVGLSWRMIRSKAQREIVPAAILGVVGISLIIPSVPQIILRATLTVASPDLQPLLYVAVPVIAMWYLINVRKHINEKSE